MKVFKKRVFAFLIDSFFIAFIVSDLLFLMEIININHSGFESFFALLFVLKDCVFKNGSLGKKIMGLAIYNVNWQRPRFVHSLKRTVASYFYILFFMCRRLYNRREENTEKMTFFLWEKNTMNAFVIDKKVYEKLKANAEQMDGIFSDNMTELYMMYLRDIYA